MARQELIGGSSLTSPRVIVVLGPSPRAAQNQNRAWALHVFRVKHQHQR